MNGEDSRINATFDLKSVTVYKINLNERVELIDL